MFDHALSLRAERGVDHVHGGFLRSFRKTPGQGPVPSSASACFAGRSTGFRTAQSSVSPGYRRPLGALSRDGAIIDPVSDLTELDRTLIRGHHFEWMCIYSAHQRLTGADLSLEIESHALFA